jgi:hypothetical protein
MRSRLALTIVFLTSVPAFSQPFTLESTGGTINFGSAPLHIAIFPNGGFARKRDFCTKIANPARKTLAD